MRMQQLLQQRRTGWGAGLLVPVVWAQPLGCGSAAVAALEVAAHTTAVLSLDCRIVSGVMTLNVQQLCKSQLFHAAAASLFTGEQRHVPSVQVQPSWRCA
jgi:type 1 glutamine amidotransferase